MKRPQFLIGLALLVTLSAALLGINYRLNHPPLSKSDKEFRAHVAGADSVQITQLKCVMNGCHPVSPATRKSLDARQTREFIELIHVLDKGPGAWLWNQWPVTAYRVRFERRGERIAGYEFRRTPEFTATIVTDFQKLSPRSGKHLWRFLDQIEAQQVADSGLD